MKILITEQQYRFILSESSKKDILINKLGLSEENADILDRLCGPLSVWMGNKLIQQINIRDINRDDYKKYYNNFISFEKSHITGIMDYIRIGRGGNIQSIKDIKYDDLYRLSDDWHKSLDIGDGDFNYVEKNHIIRDYRKGGIGYYWVDLNTPDSREECNRMGHCGRTSYDNTIFSLRETKRISDGFTINKSCLTAAIGRRDRILYQLKGPKNSKPQEKYFPYIIDLLSTRLIKGFGTEYNTENDFKISDLPELDVRNLYNLRPELFTGRREKKLLQQLGLLEKTSDIFLIKLDPDDVHRYVDGDWEVRNVKSKDGRTTRYGLFETLLSGEIYDLYDLRYTDYWKASLKYYTDKENTERIKNIIMRKAQSLNIDLTDYNLEESIEEVDDDTEIKDILSDAYETAGNDAAYDHFYKELKNCLSKYGNVLKMDDSGVLIEINFDTFVKTFDVNEDDRESSLDSCNDDLKCAFEELVISDYISNKPEFSIDDRWYPDIDENNFNEILKERLNEIE